MFRPPDATFTYFGSKSCPIILLNRSECMTGIGGDNRGPSLYQTREGWMGGGGGGGKRHVGK
jgi:hypothetical protein